MSIRLKLTIMFLAIASIPLLLFSVLTFSNYKDSLEANRVTQLQLLASYRADKIETYFAGLRKNIEISQPRPASRPRHTEGGRPARSTPGRRW